MSIKVDQILALIPARGGSKSIPRKNVKRLGGHPLLAYSIAAGRQARCVSRVLVSTDDDEIAGIAERYGAEAPFRRPAALAEDHVRDYPVFEHALQWLDAEEGYRPDVVVQLRPTSPLRPPSCIDDAVATLLADADADAVRSVTPSGQNPYKMWRLHDGVMTPLLDSAFDEPFNMPRQKLPPTYWQTGHIDAIRTRTITQKHSLTGDRIAPLIIEPGYAVDIDTIEQWQMAEWVLRHRSLDFVRPAQPARTLADVRMLVLDFDGVLTDNRVYVRQDGLETVACDRGDGMGLELLRRHGVTAMELSKERNPVVTVRCEKLGIPCYQGVDEKPSLFKKLVAEQGLQMEHVAYVGNDVNDLGCLRLAGWGVAVADAHPEALAAADWVLGKPGGRGAVREFCDAIIASKEGIRITNA